MNDSPRISFLMKMITDRMDAMITRELDVNRVTAAQGRVLAYLISRDGEPVCQKDVEQHLGVSHTTAKGILGRLEEKGLVTTGFDSEDGRVKNVYLTDLSRSTHSLIEEQIGEFEQFFLKGVSDEDRDVLKRALMRIYENIK